MKEYLKFIAVLVLAISLGSCGEDEDCSGCQLIPEVGPCDAAIPIYYYDQDSMKCVEFLWGGCEGVVPFESLEACQSCDC